MFWIPLSAIEAGPGKVRKGSAIEGTFWSGSIDFENDKPVGIIGSDGGPLEGLVRLAGDENGVSTPDVTWRY